MFETSGAWLVVAAVAYLVVAVVGGSRALRWAMGSPTMGAGNCPQAGYNDASGRAYCRKYHPADCIRKPGTVTPFMVTCSVLIGLAWPIAAVPVAVIALATSQSAPEVRAFRTKELEVELGMTPSEP